MNARALAVALVLALAPALATAQADAPTGATKVASGLLEPVDFAFGRDGYVYYVELTGKQVRRLALDTGEVDPEPVAKLPDVHAERFTETGLFGFALHPDFHENGVMYVSYSKNESGTFTNVLSRVERGNETVLAERPGSPFHNGGRIMVADGYLWWTTGDATNPFTAGDPKVAGQPAQEDGVMRGKVMRLTMDGAPAPGNPWGDAAFTKGHRNVYGIAWDPENSRVFVTENGNSEADELNVLAAGSNYGWPECEGACDPPNPQFTDPVHAWDGTVAPTGATWFRGAFWFGTFNQGDVMRFSDESGSWVLDNVHHYPGSEKMPPRVLDVEMGPDGASLYFTTWDELWRLDFADDPEYPAHEPREPEPYWWQEPVDDPVDDPGGDGSAGDGSTGEEEPGDEARGFIPAAGAMIVPFAVAAAAVALARSRK